MESWLIVLYLALVLLVGSIMTKLMKIMKLPNVTGYLIGGLLIGPFVLGNLIGLFNNGEGFGQVQELVKDLAIIETVALGFIAFSIGGEFRLGNLKKLGAKILVVTLLQAFAATLFVDVSLILFFLIKGQGVLAANDIAVAITLGAIATATAPAATLMVVRQYKAKGPLVDTLLPVVAADDAIGLMIFSISFSIACTLASGSEINAVNMVVFPVLEIVESLAIGAVLGGILTLLVKWFKVEDTKLVVMLLFVFGGVGISQWLNLSDLLVCMMIGAIYCNLSKESIHEMEHVDHWTPSILMAFFVLSGANLDLGALTRLSIVLVALVYIIFRSLGKYFGAFLGCKWTKCHPNVTKYLGLTLLPQAGVAIGMANTVAANKEFGGYTTSDGTSLGTIVVTVVLVATLIYELVGPVITKMALHKAGEIPGEFHKISEHQPVEKVATSNGAPVTEDPVEQPSNEEEK